jgi:hypothetical protein
MPGAVTLGLVLLSLYAAAQTPGPAPQGGSGRTVQAEPILDLDALLERLRSMAPRTVPGVVRVLSGLDPTPGQELSGLDRELSNVDGARVLDLLEPSRHDGITAELKLCARTAASDRTTLGMLRVLERFGSAEDLLGAARWTQSEIELYGSDALLEATLRDATHRILRRDARGFEWISGVIQSSRADVGSSLCRGAGDTDSLRALPVFANLLGWSADLDVGLLQQIGRLSAQCELPAEPRLQSVVRGFLGSDDPRVAREAAVVCARLEDFDAADVLVDLLDGEDRSVSEASAWALATLTGLAFGEDAGRWRTWLASEEQWLDEAAPGLTAALQDPDAGQVVLALNELSRHRYQRATLAAGLLPGLEDERADIRLLTCTALGRIGSKAALIALIESLDDPEQPVSNAAHAALCQISGRELPPDPQVWMALVAGEQAASRPAEN